MPDKKFHLKLTEAEKKLKIAARLRVNREHAFGIDLSRNHAFVWDFIDGGELK